jgi:hypothetical protein
MPDALLAPTDREEALSSAYVRAIAAHAGYVVATMDFDRDGIDIEIKAGGSMRPSLGIQLKATINLGEPKAGVFSFPLKRRNYDLLRIPTQTPRILIVLSLPKDMAGWLAVTTESLVLRRCAFWASLAGFPDTDNTDSVSVPVEKGNLFDVECLMALMEKSRTGTIA